MDAKEHIQQLATWVGTATLRDSVDAARQGDAASQRRVAGAMVWAAFSCPDAIEPTYDVIASAWLGTGEAPDIPTGLPQAPLEASFWDAFFSAVDDAEKGYDAASITARVASLGGSVHPSFRQISEDCASPSPRGGRCADQSGARADRSR